MDINLEDGDLSTVYDALLSLAGGEGCTVLEALANHSDIYTARRIYDDLFSEEAMVGAKTLRSRSI